jgi:hypothetical protein
MILKNLDRIEQCPVVARKVSLVVKRWMRMDRCVDRLWCAALHGQAELGDGMRRI